MIEPTSQKIRTRFAPSPTGYLHLGHAYSAIQAFDFASSNGGEFVLRIEDTDNGRCRKEFETAIYEDLAWLGLQWPDPVLRQSEHFPRYMSAIATLSERGLTYPCFCTRQEIAAEIARSISAPHGAEGPLYPGTCKRLSQDERLNRIESRSPYAVRLDLERALASVQSESLAFEELGAGPYGETGLQQARPETLGDIVLARKDTPTSYHVSVVLDDAYQGTTHIVRGRDLFHATHIHCLLQALWDLPTPKYLHHDLIVDEKGNRLAKRDQSQTIRALRFSGATPVEARERLQPRPS